MRSGKGRAGTAGLAVAVALATLSWNVAEARIVAMEVSIKIDQVAPKEQKNGMKVGQVHKACVFFDDSKIDPKTHRVALLHETHAGGVPPHLDPQQMPMNNAWLDLSAMPIRYHFAAAPTTALPAPYFILFSEKTMRMTIYSQADGERLLSGRYTVNPKRISGPAVDAVVATSDPALPPWDTAPVGFKLPAGGPPKGSRPTAEPPACPAGVS